MLRLHSIYKDVVNALHRARHGTPPPIGALRLLGIRNRTISQWTGVSQTLVSFWANGRQPIASTHYRNLIQLLCITCAEAAKALDEVAAKSNAPQLEDSFKAYQDRVRCAGEILNGLQKR